MGKTLITVIFSSFALMAQAQEEHVKWAGHITLPDGKQMPLEFETFLSDNITTANARSPAQGKQNIPVTNLKVSDKRWTMQLPTLAAELDMVQQEACLTGELKQGVALPVKLCPVASSSNDEYLAELSQEVMEIPHLRFQSTDGTWLSGTLYHPANMPEAPVAILAGGSGPNDRDASFFDKKPYRNFGIELAKQGIALFSYDKRGIRRSSGSYTEAKVEDYAKDTQTAFELIKGMKEIKPKHIGLVGHSEGASVVAITATMVKADFVISLGGIGLSGIDAIVLQDKTESIGRGATIEQAQMLQQLARDYYTVVINTSDDIGREEQARKLLNALNPKQQEVYLRYGADSYTLNIKNVNDKALSSILKTDPIQYWQKVCVPVLVLNGDKDLQVPADENVAGLKQALMSCQHPATQTKVLANYNHLFQSTTDGNVKLYATLPEGFDTNVSAIVAQWITSL